MPYYVYLLLDPTDYYKPFYVGKGSSDRAAAHMWPSSVGENKFKDNKIAKIRRLGGEPTILIWEKDLSEKEAYELEELLIRRFGRRRLDEDGILTNICLDVRPPSPARRIVSLETRKKISERQKGSLNHRFGKKFTPDQKAKRSKIIKELGIKPPIRTGPMAEETKAKIAAAHLGKRHSLETKTKMSNAKRGKKRGPPSPETIEKIRQGNLAARAKLTELQKEILSQKIREGIYRKQ